MNDNEVDKLKDSINADLIQTHISWILLSKDLVYKIKKPVKFSFLDFSTLEKRKLFCEEEVRLNKRLSPEIYLGITSIRSNGQVGFEGNGKIIEYAVKMKRLPEDRRMDGLLTNNKVTPDDIIKIAEIVSDFHKRIDSIEDKKYNSADMVKEQINDLGSFKEVIEQAGNKGDNVDSILQKSNEFISKNKELFEKRQIQGRIKDCHGDLHSANIFIEKQGKIVIFDCIEFNKEIRYIDLVCEVAFMAMDLDAFEREDYSKLFIEKYVELSGDNELISLINFYKCYRANVRAKIAAIEYSQKPNPNAKQKIEKYIELAEKYANNL